jgi:hypothetical protein
MCTKARSVRVLLHSVVDFSGPNTMVSIRSVGYTEPPPTPDPVPVQSTPLSSASSSPSSSASAPASLFRSSSSSSVPSASREQPVATLGCEACADVPIVVLQSNTVSSLEFESRPLPPPPPSPTGVHSDSCVSPSTSSIGASDGYQTAEDGEYTGDACNSLHDRIVEISRIIENTHRMARRRLHQIVSEHRVIEA